MELALIFLPEIITGQNKNLTSSPLYCFRQCRSRLAFASQKEVISKSSLFLWREDKIEGLWVYTLLFSSLGSAGLETVHTVFKKSPVQLGCIYLIINTIKQSDILKY